MTRIVRAQTDGTEFPITPVVPFNGTEVIPSRTVLGRTDGTEIVLWEPGDVELVTITVVDDGPISTPIIWTVDAPGPGREANLNTDKFKTNATERAYILDWAQANGLRYVREAIGEGIGGNSSGATFNWTWFDAIVDECEARGLKLLAELKIDDVTNPDNFGPLWTANVIYKVTNCVQRIVNRGKLAVIDRFLVWNEPDADQGTRTLAQHADIIVRSAQLSYTAIKSVAPTARLEFPPCTNVGAAMVQELFNRGATQFCDIFGIHTYQGGVNRRNDAGANNTMGIHQTWAKMAAGTGPQTPLACSEWATLINRAPFQRRTRNLSSRKPAEFSERTIAGTTGQTANGDATATVAAQISYDNAGSGTFTIQPDASVNLATGSVVELIPISSGSITAAAGAGVTLTGTPLTASPGSPIRLTKNSANNWTASACPAGLYGSLPVSDFYRVDNWHAHYNLLARVMLAAAACSSDTYYSVQGSGDGWANAWWPYVDHTNYTERQFFTDSHPYLFEAERYHLQNFNGTFEGAGAQLTVAGSDSLYPWLVHYNPMGTVFGTASDYPERDRVTFPTNATLAKTGTRYCRMAAGKINELLRLVTGVITGRTYTVRAWVALDNGGGGQCELRGYGYDPRDGDTFKSTPMATANGQYQQIEIQITPQLPWFVIGLYHNGTNNCRWDDVTIDMHAGVASPALAAITSHTRPTGANSIPAYADFTVSVNGTDVPVYQLSRPTSHVFDATTNPPTEPVGHAYFDMGSGVAEVTVTVANRGAITSALVLPAAFGISTVASANTVRFTITGHGHYILYVNGDASPLYLSAMPEETDAPASSGDANVAYYTPGSSVSMVTGKSIHYFGPGIYTLAGTQWSLRSNDQVYIAAGAVVRGRMFGTTAWNAGGVGAKTNIKVFGRGILNNAEADVHAESARESVLNWLNVTGLTVSGICEINSAGFCNKTIRCRNVLFDGLRVFGRGRNSDGIDLINCQVVEVKNMLIVNWDDCLCIKAIGDGDDLNEAYYPSPRHYADADNSVHTIYIHDCVVSAQCGNGDMEIGYECVCPEMYNISFERIYSVRSWHKAFFGIYLDYKTKVVNGLPVAIPSARIHNITVRDVYCEDIRGSGANPKPKIIDLTVVGPAGSIDTVDIKNLIATGDAPSLVDGYNASPNNVSNVTIRNFSIDGSVKLSAAAANMTVTNATGVTFAA